MENDKLIDMHTHTIYSDGDLSPNQLIELAVKRNISTLGITDHNTIEGLRNINRDSDVIRRSGIEIVNGIELSAKVESGRMHILGYGFDIDNVDLKNKMTELKDNSVNSVLSILEQIKRDYNIRFSYNDIKELINANHNLGRPDIARLCVKYGYADSISDAFKKYLIDAHEKTRSVRKGLNYKDCLDLFKKANALSILAHPKTLCLDEHDLKILIKDMIELGLDGIEVYHSTHTQEEIEIYLAIASEYNLLVSGGSDYHGKTVKPDIELGTGRNNNLKIKKLSLLDKLK